MTRSTERWLTTDEPHRLGSGWLSGTVGAVLGLAALGTALCFLLPAHLTTPALRPHYSAPPIRALLFAAITLAFGLGTVSLLLRRKKTLGTIAVVAALLATFVCALVDESGPASSTTGLGLDVFVLSMLLYTAVFVPLERLWPHAANQPTFRPEWWTDFAWFASSALLVQLSTFLVVAPGTTFAALVPATLQAAVGSLPFLVQIVAIVIVSDFVQYWVHRACHRVPLLWRFHRIHHSAQHLDWLAGSRLHLVDALLTRLMVFFAIALLGFTPAAIGTYLVFVAAQATFVHANVGWALGWLEPWLTTPRFHHWHHAESPPDVNFAVHLPLLDRLFGTWHLPADTWPAHYGLGGGAASPRGFWRQLVEPFVR